MRGILTGVRNRLGHIAIVSTLGLAGGLLGLPLQAQTSVSREVHLLIQQDRYDEAYELALEHRFELEGDLMFDFHYGFSALEKGHHSEGVFALERVVMRQPGFSRARLELARGYFLMGDDTRANHHFDIVRAQEPPATVVANIDHYQQLIRERSRVGKTTISGHVGLALGYDTNVNSATSADAVEIVFGSGTAELSLPEESQETADARVRTTAEVNLSHTVTAQDTAFTIVDLEATNHPNETAFNAFRAGARAGIRRQGEVYTPSASLRVQTFWLDGDHYQNVYGLSLNLRQQFSPSMIAQYGLDLARQQYTDRPNNDADSIIASAGWMQGWAGRWQPLMNLSVFAGKVMAHENSPGAMANTERMQWGLGGMGRLQLAPGWRLTTRSQYRHSAYDSENSLFDKTRSDNFFQASLSADWMPLQQFQITPRIEYRVNDSNIDIYTFDRTLVETQVHYRF